MKIQSLNASMQNRRQGVRARVYLLRCTGTGVVRHHAPALGRAHIHIGGQHKRGSRGIRQVQGDAFDQIVHGAGDRFYFAHMFRMGINDAVAEHIFKGLTDIVYADQTRAAGMYTHHIFIIRPTGHEPFNIAFL
mgnify:CR=1 FL=1